MGGEDLDLPGDCGVLRTSIQELFFVQKVLIIKKMENEMCDGCDTLGAKAWSWSSQKPEVCCDFNLPELSRVSTIPSRLSQSLANLSA